MVADALESERLIAMAWLKPGWETQYEGRPEFHEHVCVGSIVNHKRLPDGRYEMLLYGLFRAKVLEETASTPYRKVKVEVLADAFDRARGRDVAARTRDVLARLPGRRGRVGRLRMLATQVRGLGGGAGRLADAAADAADLSPEDRYRILAEADVLRRLDLLIAILDRNARGTDASLPPRADPSLN
jgi:Lon protease-like protein